MYIDTTKKNKYKYTKELSQNSYQKKFQKKIQQRKKTAPSSEEKTIMDLLNRHQIKFIREHYFEGCVNPRTLWPLFFDFYLPDYNVAIEYDGIYHYEPIHGERLLTKRKERDQIKTLYCRAKGIKLLRIPYTTDFYNTQILEALCL